MDFTKDIYINKDKIYEDQEIVVLYKGFLFSNNLTNDVYISLGYGNMWDNKEEIRMKPSTFGYLATVKVGSGETLQFCFRDGNGNWDNNNYANYILPILENEEILSFKTLADTSKVVNFEPFDQKVSDETENKEDLFETSVVNSNSFELYKTVDLENTDKKSIPNDTIITQISLNPENEKVVSHTVIKAEKPEESISTAFASITDKAKEQSVKAFDEDKVTAGSVYVNSIVKDIKEEPKVIENIEEKSMTVKEDSTLSKVTTFIERFTKSAKLAFSKLVKLIKTSLNFNEDEQ